MNENCEKNKLKFHKKMAQWRLLDSAKIILLNPFHKSHTTAHTPTYIFSTNHPRHELYTISLVVHKKKEKHSILLSPFSNVPYSNRKKFNRTDSHTTLALETNEHR